LARFLFAAHDPGGALMLSACHREAVSRGHDITFVAAGPTAALWRDRGFALSAVDDAAAVSLDDVDAVITGSGFAEFERDLWRRARRHQLATLAAIDAWTNLQRRFEASDGVIQPDAVAVLDTPLRDQLAALEGWSAHLFIVGQPHLQEQTARLALRRRQHGKSAGRHQLVFFSEPVREDYGTSRGFDQFEVFAALMKYLDDVSDVQIRIKPHPREDAGAWQDVAGDRATLAGGSAADLLVEADGVLGMTSMVLIEAHLLGLPVLSLQPERTAVVNPLIEDICAPLVDWHDLRDRWRAFAAGFGMTQPVAPRFDGLLRAADQRMVDAMEAVAEPAGDH